MTSSRHAPGGAVRYEVIQLAQFLMVLLLISGTFAAGLFVGWARWGYRSHAEAKAVETRIEADRSEAEESVRVSPGTLFSPGPSSRVIVLAADDLVDLRDPPVVGDGSFGPMELGPALENLGPDTSRPK
ncbi:MAG TPA: hypothetical protein VL068_12825 [Microthrixaceae bacterium]|nr:hypothetical protein [Microthrixaceae bacterium]